MEDWTRNQDKRVTEYAERTYINVTAFQGDYRLHFPPLISYQRGSEESNVQRLRMTCMTHSIVYFAGKS